MTRLLLVQQTASAARGSETAVPPALLCRAPMKNPAFV